ncbi:hypothetical protein K438DRAFT_1783420 [Mycena galopus ATCC 62051]|nr:hypothetical protein K438DRAFT_1783420 [Mycena galopus ATCC 62051]
MDLPSSTAKRSDIIPLEKFPPATEFRQTPPKVNFKPSQNQRNTSRVIHVRVSLSDPTRLRCHANSSTHSSNVIEQILVCRDITIQPMHAVRYPRSRGLRLSRFSSAHLHELCLTLTDRLGTNLAQTYSIRGIPPLNVDSILSISRSAGTQLPLERNRITLIASVVQPRDELNRIQDRRLQTSHTASDASRHRDARRMSMFQLNIHHFAPRPGRSLAEPRVSRHHTTYRLWIIWGQSRRIIIFPTLALLGVAISAVGDILEITKWQPELRGAAFINEEKTWTGTVFVLSLLFYRLSHMENYEGEISLRISFDGKWFVSILAESAALQTLWLIFTAMMLFSSSDLDFIATDNFPVILGISNTLIYARVGLGWSQGSGVEHKPHSPAKHASDAVCSIRSQVAEGLDRGFRAKFPFLDSENAQQTQLNDDPVEFNGLVTGESMPVTAVENFLAAGDPGSKNNTARECLA